jgi:hypothetical protein
MAFTEAQLVAQLDPASTGLTIKIQSLIPGPTITDVYAVGEVAPYAGRSRWVQVQSSNTAAQAAAAIQTALA